MDKCGPLQLSAFQVSLLPEPKIPGGWAYSHRKGFFHRPRITHRFQFPEFPIDFGILLQ